jgi:dTDP-4-amino-4,6-dideoxygalactose transaminase
LGNYGRNEKNKQKFEILGYNSRLDPIQAAVLNEFLPYLDKWNDVRKSIAMKYKESILENNNFEFIPRDNYSTNSVWHHFVVLVKHRTKFIKYMKAKGINTDIHYEIPSHRQPSFPVNKNKKLIFPNVDKIYKEMVSLPMHPWLGDEEVIYISKVLRNYKS